MARRILLALTVSWLIMLPGSVCGQTLDDARAAVRVRDYESAVNIYENLARSGDPEAAYQLAAMYRAGRGVEQDIEVATEWMMKSANAGDARAQYSMGQLVLNADESQIGREKAREWYEKAAMQGHTMAVRSLEVMNQPTGPAVAGMTAIEREDALCQAARQGDLEMVRVLLGTYPYETLSGTRERTALVEAIIARHADIVAILLQNGADPNDTSKLSSIPGRVIPLHAAVRSETPAILSMLLAAGADVERKDEAGNTALIIASSTGRDNMVLVLLAGGARIETTDNRGWTALTAARQKNHLRVEQILLDHGAPDPLLASAPRRTELDMASTAEGEAGWTPLMYAAWRGEVDTVKRILRKQPEIDAVDRDGHTALSRASWQGHVEIVDALLVSGADPNIRQNNGFTPLLWATQNGHSETIRSLVAAYASLDVAIPATGYSPMLLACSRQDAVTAKLLLALGIDPDWRSPKGETALMVVAMSESGELLGQLLDHGADAEMRDDRGRTAIWYAIISGRHRNLSILLDYDANSEARDDSNQHPLIEAVRTGDAGVVQILLQHGVQPDVQSGSGNSALIVAATTGNLDVMHILIGAGANLDVRNQQGQSALMRATISGQRDAVILLLAAGADTRLVDGDHKTAHDLAELIDQPEILEVLEQHRSR